MISHLKLEYFKCFKRADLDFTPLTVLTGLNSSGKSTVLQALRLVKNDGAGFEEHGGADDIISVHSSERRGMISVSFDQNHSHQSTRTVDFPLIKGASFGPSANLNISVPMYYISADRFGPRVFLPLNDNSFDVGEKGENVFGVISRGREDSGVPDLLRRNDNDTYGIFENIKSWMSIISPGFDVEVQPIRNADIAVGSFASHRPVNVGFGLSYALPIITQIIVCAALTSRKEAEFCPTVLVENPEAHLHPRGQTEMGRLLARAAACGVQVIVETHSDHLLNGVRLTIKERELPHQDAIFYYFEHNYREEYSSYTPIYSDEHGMLDHWPEGFFDEYEKNLLGLL